MINSFRLISIAAAFNRIFFAGSGYVLSSLLSKHKSLSFQRAMGAFVIIEVSLLMLWIAAALYYSAQPVIEMPWIILPISLLLVVFFLFKKEKFISLVGSFWGYILEVKTIIPIVILLNSINCLLFVMYYSFLFQYFNIHIAFWNVLKIVSILLTVSHLSPSPSGIGFKECAMSLLLVEVGVPLTDSILVTVVDRIVLTGFWLLLGASFGYNVIKSEFAIRYGNFSRRVKKLYSK